MEIETALRSDFNELLARLGITSKDLEGIGLQASALEEIYNDHIGATADLRSVGTYISQRLQQVSSVHSLRVRVKNPEHLVEKIIRKKSERPDLNFDLQTYQELLTDRIGLRALHLFKDEWHEIHKFVRDTWDLHEDPIAYVREGDSKVLRDGFEAAGCKVINHPFNYRSIHYILTSQPEKRTYLAELQVRTIFEEGWSEIDHRVRYPCQSNDVFLAEMLGILNRLSGSADEIGTFIKGLIDFLSVQAGTISDHERQIEQKESDLQKTISKLEIAQGDKDDLNKQLQGLKKQYEELKESSLQFEIGTGKFPRYFSGVGISDPGTLNLDSIHSAELLSNGASSALYMTPSWKRTCPICGKKYDDPYSVPGMPTSKCPECRLNPNHFAGILNYGTAAVPNSVEIQARTCPKCGKNFFGSYSVLDILPPTCSDCRNKGIGIWVR